MNGKSHIFNSGQSCCAIERVYVRDTVYDKFVEEVVKCVKSYKLGDPFDESDKLGTCDFRKSSKNYQSTKSRMLLIVEQRSLFPTMCSLRQRS